MNQTTPPNVSSKPKVVIIGAGFAGLTVARSLKNVAAQITVIDRSNHHLFQPLLYQVATATLSPAEIAAPIRNILRYQLNTDVVMAEVTGVDLQGNFVHLGEKNISFDYLVVATGATHGYFGHDAWEQYAPGLKSIVDATEVRQKILWAFEMAEMETDAAKRQELMTFILVGGGPTGVEMSGAIAELAHRALAADFRRIDPKSARVLLVEAGPRILSSFPESLSAKAKATLEKLNVEVRTDTRVENVDAQGVYVEGKLIPSRTVIWAAGVVASPAGKWLNAEMDRAGRVKVTPFLNLAGHENVFVIGDTASVTDEKRGPLPGVAPVAMQEGRYVAAALRRKLAGRSMEKAFRYWDKGNLATVGRSSAVADLGKIKLSGWIAWLAWLGVHIFYLIGFRNRVFVMLDWFWGYITFQRGARLITTETYPHAASSWSEASSSANSKLKK